MSYGTLAKRVNSPKGFRAVANANSKNPFSIIVPCHRVIASDGKIGGYTGGLDKKKYLLALEGVTYKA
ncbi:MAG: methylated-DNA--[protein]-cysteine S-methyltransferase [Moraxellaceae bacterium]